MMTKEGCTKIHTSHYSEFVFSSSLSIYCTLLTRIQCKVSDTQVTLKAYWPLVYTKTMRNQSKSKVVSISPLLSKQLPINLGVKTENLMYFVNKRPSGFKIPFLKLAKCELNCANHLLKIYKLKKKNHKLIFL